MKHYIGKVNGQQVYVSARDWKTVEFYLRDFTDWRELRAGEMFSQAIPIITVDN